MKLNSDTIKWIVIGLLVIGVGILLYNNYQLRNKDTVVIEAMTINPEPDHLEQIYFLIGELQVKLEASKLREERAQRRLDKLTNTLNQQNEKIINLKRATSDDVLNSKISDILLRNRK